MKKALTLILSILGASLNLSAAPQNCEQLPKAPEWAVRSTTEMNAYIQKIQPKVDGIHNTFPAKINGKDLVLHYVNYKATATPRKGTLVYLCGGPGNPCNANGRPSHLPAGYDILVMDYMGVGENNKLNTPELMSIESHGTAVAQMLNHLKAKDVIIYGHSYGTTVATVASSQLTSKTQKNSASIKGVFLEGIVGKGDYKNYEKSFARAADAAWALLSETEKENFKTAYTAITKKLTPKEIELFNGQLTQSVVMGTMTGTMALKGLRADKNIEQLKQLLKNVEARKSIFTTGDSLNQIRAAGCQIFSGSEDGKTQKIFGGIVTVVTPMPKGTCECKAALKIWDPNQYQIQGVPVLYLNGEQDPNTAIEWAKGHYDGQTQVSDKVLISRKYGGHGDTHIEPMKSCVSTFFESLEAQDLSNLKSKRKSIEEQGCSSESSGVNQMPKQDFKGTR